MRKYSEKYLNNWKILSGAIVGLEIEFYSNLSFYKLQEQLNQEFAPVKFHGFNTYHAAFTPDKDNFKVEIDLSGGNMREIVTGPMDYFTARYNLIKLLHFVQKWGYTTDKSSIHINISFDNKKSDRRLIDLNILKHILKTDEEDIYRVFPVRKNNIYAKSIKKMIPFRDYDFSNVAIDTVKNVMKLPDDRYYGVNYLHMNNYEGCRLEYRYIGGEGYEQKVGDIMDLMDRFIITTYNCIGQPFDTYDVEELNYYLNKKITNFKNFSNYDNFIVEYPTIKLQVDQIGQYEIVNSYYSKIYDRLYTLIDSIDNLKDCVINYVTETHKIEIVEANFKSVQNINGFDFINCDMFDGIYTDCTFYNCIVVNTQLDRCKIDASEIKSGKLTSCNVQSSRLEDCYFMAGYLDSSMTGGVFRSGKIGPNAILSSTTKVIKSDLEGEGEEILDMKDKKIGKIFKK